MNHFLVERTKSFTFKKLEKVAKLLRKCDTNIHKETKDRYEKYNTSKEQRKNLATTLKGQK